MSSNPVNIGAYEIVRELSLTSYLARDEEGRLFVLKPLDPQCTPNGQLHQAIRERLSRVRELAHAGVANLIGVERDDLGSAWIIWQFIPGRTFAEIVPTLTSPESFAHLAREIVLSVQSLHRLGIVHGQLHGNNILLDEKGMVRLTHISPLLYETPETDVIQLGTMLAESVLQPPWAKEASTLARCATFEELSACIANLREPRIQAATSRHPRQLRLRMILSALLVGLFAVLFAEATILWLNHREESSPGSSVRSSPTNLPAPSLTAATKPTTNP